MPKTVRGRSTKKQTGSSLNTTEPTKRSPNSIFKNALKFLQGSTAQNWLKKNAFDLILTQTAVLYFMWFQINRMTPILAPYVSLSCSVSEKDTFLQTKYVACFYDLFFAINLGVILTTCRFFCSNQLPEMLHNLRVPQNKKLREEIEVMYNNSVISALSIIGLLIFLIFNCKELFLSRGKLDFTEYTIQSKLILISQLSNIVSYLVFTVLTCSFSVYNLYKDVRDIIMGLPFAIFLYFTHNPLSIYWMLTSNLITLMVSISTIVFKHKVTLLKPYLKYLKVSSLLSILAFAKLLAFEAYNQNFKENIAQRSIEIATLIMSCFQLLPAIFAGQ